MQLAIDDMRRQMDVNYWGQVYGSITAVRHLRARRRADQRRERPLRPRDPLAGQRLRRETRAEGVHRLAAVFIG
jgi:hypothetical protein